VRYGDERKDDTLVIQPIGNAFNTDSFQEGINLIEFSSWDYSPNEDNFVNFVHKNYNYTIKDSKKNDIVKTGTSVKLNHDSINRYKRVETHEFLNDISSQGAADIISQKEVDVGAFKYPAYKLKIKGCLLVEPGQYAMTIIDNEYINGTPLIKSVIYDFDFENGLITTQVDLNRPSREFNNFMRAMKKDLRNIGIKGDYNKYASDFLTGKSGTSPGAFN
jgi:hypothetical protein